MVHGQCKGILSDFSGISNTITRQSLNLKATGTSLIAIVYRPAMAAFIVMFALTIYIITRREA